MKAVIALLHHAQVDKLLDRLEAAGVSHSDVALMASAELDHVSEVIEEHSDENTVKGALAGSAIGGTLATLGAIALVPVPGVGPFLASGVIASTIGGVAGGYYGALAGSRASEQEEINIKDHMEKDDVLVVVHTHNNEDEIKAILRDCGGREIAVEDINPDELRQHGKIGADNE